MDGDGESDFAMDLGVRGASKASVPPEEITATGIPPSSDSETILAPPVTTRVPISGVESCT